MAKFKKGKLKDKDSKLGNFDPIPAGKYQAQAIKSDVVPYADKKTKGNMMKYTWEVMKGEFKGRLIFENICFDHPDAETEAFAEKAINSMCEAVGVSNVKFVKSGDTTMVHKRPILLGVGVKAAEGKYQAGNKVTSYEPLKKGGKHKDEKGKKGKKEKRGKKGKSERPW